MKIELPVYTTKLPVKDISVEFKPLVVKEEKIIASAKETGSPMDGYNTLIKLIDTKTDIDTNDLTETDLIHLMLQIRKKSIGEKFKTGFNCPYTGQPVSLEVNCSDIKVAGDSKSKNVLTDKLSIDLKIPKNFSDISSCIESIESIKEKVEFSTLSQEQRNEIIDSLPILTKNKIENAVKSLLHYEHTLEYESAGTKRKIKLSSAEDFFTLLFVM
jgi:hypothetical protein|tara:strand:- start:35 stop:679 length:645 start_codon:yes stop_codon:yes gene_type:complete